MTSARVLSFDGRAIDVEAVIRSARVTDHALVRWLERVEGYPVAALRRAILSRPAVLQGIALGASGIQLPDLGAHLILVDRRVVTIRKIGGEA